MNELDAIFGDVKKEVNDLCEEAHKICNPEEEKKSILGKNATKMNYSPFENVPAGHRRCGKCGEVHPTEEFKRAKKPGYDWKCKDCNKFDEVYQ